MRSSATQYEDDEDDEDDDCDAIAEDEESDGEDQAVKLHGDRSVQLLPRSAPIHTSGAPDELRDKLARNFSSA